MNMYHIITEFIGPAHNDINRHYYYYADPYMIVVKMIYQNEMIFFR